MSELPVHDVRDPKALRALSHPVRIRMLEELALSGPLTATEIAERVGESPANCSWHLRQLARYGFVEEADGGPGRRRPWRIVVQQNKWREGDEDPELRTAGTAASEVLLAREHEALQGWLAAVGTEPAHWQDAAFVAQSIGWLTAEELRQMGAEITAILMRFTDRIEDPGRRPSDARPVRLMAWGVPARPFASEGAGA